MPRFTVRLLMVVVVTFGLALGLISSISRSPAAPEYAVVLCEGMFLSIAASLAWFARRSQNLFASGVFLGMAVAAFLHGVYFGVMKNDHPGQHAATLAGFGVTSAGFVGVPLGVILGAGLILTRRIMGGATDRPTPGN